MSAFSQLAKKTIRSLPDGRRILALHRPFARPYDVSGPDTEERVVRRLSWAYRGLQIPILALMVFLYVWPNRYTLFAGLAVTAAAGWTVVWASLYPDLRHLKRIARPSRERASSGQFIRDLASPDRELLLRKRSNMYGACVSACLLAALGVCLAVDGWWFGYVIAAFAGFGRETLDFWWD